MISIKYNARELQAYLRKLPEMINQGLKRMSRGRRMEIPRDEISSLPKIKQDMAKAMGKDRAANKEKLKPGTADKIVKFITDRLFKD